MTTLQAVELGVLGPLQVRQDGAPVAIPGAKPRAVLTMLGLHAGSVVSADALIEMLWGEHPPRTAAKALQTHISLLRRTLGDGFVLTQGAGWTLAESEVDASRFKSAARVGRDATVAGDFSQAVARFEEALALWRGIPELPDSRRGTSEKTRWIEGHAALVEDRADALLATGRAAEVVGDLEAAVADAPLRERRWGQLMLALYRAGRQGEALGAYQRARALLAEELGVDPGPELRRLEAAIVAQDASLDVPVAQNLPAVTRAVTFFLTDIEGSTAAWEADADAMGIALARHDELVEQVVTSRGGRLIKTRGEGDATFSVFERPSAAAAAAIELQDAILHEPWALREPMRIRVALHTGEAELRDGDYFGRAVNRAARLRSLAEGSQILCSGATAELVIDSLSDDVVLNDLGMRQLKNLARPEHVFELRLEAADDQLEEVCPQAPIERPSLPPVLAGPGPFVGRGRELGRLFSAWQTTLTGGTNAVLIAGEPGVGKTRLAGEWSRQAYDQGALVIYGRCDEDLGAPYQPFAEALRSLVPCLGANGLRGLRGVEALLALVPGLTDVLPDLATPTRADPDTERYALFDAVVALLGVASAGAPVVLILDDLHWAAKPTLLLLRHLLRFGDQARVQIVGTYRSTDLDRSHPLAAMLADLHRDGTASRIQLSGLDENDVSTYVAEAGYDDEELARALASVTGGNPFFLIEALRHVDESGGHWDPSTLPQGVREAVSRRLSRLTPETNKALGAAAVVGSRFSLELVEQVVGDELVDAFDEASKAGIVIEEPGGNYRFNHALVRQSLLAELASVRRMRLHQRIATTLETQPGADDELLAELAYHYFECAWAGNAGKAVDYCRRAADQAMARLAYEGAADLYDRALHALEEIDDELPDRDEQVAALLIARCEALLAAGDVASAANAVAQLQTATADSVRLAAWATCFDGELSMLTNPERLDDIEAALSAASVKLAELDDAAGEAKAHTVRAACLARLGRVGDCEVALDDALTAARRAGEHRRVNAVLAGAPLAALWGPNPVPRAGGRCLDVVRLLRITTDSPAVEATSTRCQAVLEAFRGRAEAARRMIDSARRTVTELGLRHALLEVEQFAGLVELVVDDPAAAERHLRKAYNGFRRMGLDADTAETAALLGRACLALDREAEADDLCTESERLAGHALKPSIAWRTLRAQLLSRRSDHDEGRRVAEAAVALAERTDALVDHGDASLALATVLGNAGDFGGLRTAAARAVDLYERKGAAALAETARRALGEPVQPTAPAPSEAPAVEPDNACVRVGKRAAAGVDRHAWDEVEQLFAPDCVIESRRKVIGFTQTDVPSGEWRQALRRILETTSMRLDHVHIAVRGDRLALARLEIGTADLSSDAPQDEFLQLYGIDDEGRISLQMWFDVEDIDAAVAELDAMQARFEQALPMENAATRLAERFVAHLAAGDWDAIAEMLADNFTNDDRRRLVGSGVLDRDAQLANTRAITELFSKHLTFSTIAIRGERLVLLRLGISDTDQGSEAFQVPVLGILEIGPEDRMAAFVTLDVDDFDSAIGELDARYLAGEAAAHSHTWSVITGCFATLSRHELPPTTPDLVDIDHRHVAAFAPGELRQYLSAGWKVNQSTRSYVEVVHRLDDLGAVVTHAADLTSRQGFEAEWRTIDILTVDGDMISRCEIFDEADLEAALATFEQLSRPAPRLENMASQVADRVTACYAMGDWQAMAEVLADNYSSDDRRLVVGSGVRHGRDAHLADMRARVELWRTNRTSTVMATRGERLAVTRIGLSSRDQGREAFVTELLIVHEINADERLAAGVAFDLDDFDSALEELDARYLAGEAAAHAHTWSVITRAISALNRREMFPTTPDWVTIDHRRGPSFAPGELPALLASWKDAHDLGSSIEAVHRLNDFGAVVSSSSRETTQDGVNAEWRAISVITIAGDLINRSEFFDETDLDAAIARFEELHAQGRRLENAATRVNERIWAHFAARDWDALSADLAVDYSHDDRRRMVGAGVLRGRDAGIQDMKTIAEIAVYLATDVIAIRGQRLALTRTRFTGLDRPPQAFLAEVLAVVEIDADETLAAVVGFDYDDFDAAITELEARYIAGDAAPHSRTWTAVADGYAALNRHELPATTSGWVNIDHRRGMSHTPGEIPALLGAAWNDASDLRHYVAAVHRLNQLGAVISHMAHETSHEGFYAEWRAINVLTFDGTMVNRSEIFDEADLDAALAKFDELNTQARRLENAAARVYEHYVACFASRDWAAITEIFADNSYLEDRRRAVNAGLWAGRDVFVENLRATPSVALEAFEHIAIRGERLILRRIRWSPGDQTSEMFYTEALCLVETDTDERIQAFITFDLDDFEAAIAELDARYLAGEAAPYSRPWSVITGSYAAINRHEQPAITPDWITVDHRREIAMGPGDLIAYIGSNPDQDYTSYVETVHRLSNVGTVITYAAHETSHEGFNAEWRGLAVFEVDGEKVSRTEVFDEADIDAALARFEELQPQTPRPQPENAASRVGVRFLEHFAARGWDAMAEIVVDDFLEDDRRRVVGSGVRHGRNALIADIRAIADLGTTYLASTVATRGERLALMRHRLSFRDQGPGGFLTDVLVIVEINADEQLVASVSFDPDDIDAAVAELDARYLAGEAATHARTWSLITQANTALNGHEIPPTTPDVASIDHRRGTKFTPGDIVPYVRAMWDLAPNVGARIEVVHQLSDLGAVFTRTAKGTSPEGLDVEWREIAVLTFEGDLINRCEMFDESDLDAALARFDELQPRTPRLQNAASQITERFLAHFAAADWDALPDMMADNFSSDDRRRVVGAGVRQGRKAQMTDMQAIADLEITFGTTTHIATRGERLTLSRTRMTSRDQQPDPFYGEMLNVVEINTDAQIVAYVLFDPDDFDAAFDELDARYLAGEAEPHSRTWSFVTRANAGTNRQELPPATPDSVTIDHRLRATFGAQDLGAYVRAAYDLTPQLRVFIEAVHRLSDLGAVVTHTSRGTTPAGFEAEWRTITLMTVEGDLGNRCEIFDEANLDAALARFDELQPQTPQLENAASQVGERFLTRFAARDWEGMAGLLDDDYSSDDRRRVVGAGVRCGRDGQIADLRAIAEIWIMPKINVIATRGDRLVLTRSTYSGRNQGSEAFVLDVLDVAEINAEERYLANVSFDPDDLDAAFEELDARYLAGEAATHAQTWSVISESYAAFNRREHFPSASDWVNVDRRRLSIIEEGDLTATVQAAWDLTPDISARIAAVHRLTNLGAVITQSTHGTSQEGFDAEWRLIQLLTVDGGLVKHGELFDEADLDAALARFDELDRPTSS